MGGPERGNPNERRVAGHRDASPPSDNFYPPDGEKGRDGPERGKPNERGAGGHGGAAPPPRDDFSFPEEGRGRGSPGDSEDKGSPCQYGRLPFDEASSAMGPPIVFAPEEEEAIQPTLGKAEKCLWPRPIAVSQEENPSRARWRTGSYGEEHAGHSNAEHNCLLMTDDACARLLDQHSSRDGGAASKAAAAASLTRGAEDNSAAHPLQQVAGKGEVEDLQVVQVHQGELPEEDAAWDEWNPDVSTRGSRTSSTSRNIGLRRDRSKHCRRLPHKRHLMNSMIN
jgi:hypothetical protein